MSAPAARAFLPALRRLDGQLTVPVPDRVRILRELEYDLEELRDRLLARGFAPDDASAAAVEALVPEGVTLEELVRLHAPLYQRLTGRLPGERVRVIERSALALASASVLLGGTLILLRARILDDPSPFLWPVLALGGVLFAAILSRVFQLWIKREHGDVGEGPTMILALSAATLVLGVVGTTVDLHRLAGLLADRPELAGTLIPVWLVREATLLSVGILIALAGGLTWFLLTQWLVSVREAHRRTLGAEVPIPTTRR